MSHDKVFETFAKYFPDYVTVAWFQNGKNSVRVRQANGKEFIFSYNDPKDWKFETVDSFLNNSKGGAH